MIWAHPVCVQTCVKAWTYVLLLYGYMHVSAFILFFTSSNQICCKCEHGLETEVVFVCRVCPMMSGTGRIWLGLFLYTQCMFPCLCHDVVILKINLFLFHWLKQILLSLDIYYYYYYYLFDLNKTRTNTCLWTLPPGGF